jgi:hypothetical protein
MVNCDNIIETTATSRIESSTVRLYGKAAMMSR